MFNRTSESPEESVMLTEEEIKKNLETADRQMPLVLYFAAFVCVMAFLLIAAQ